MAEIFHIPVNEKAADAKEGSDFACIDAIATVAYPQNFMGIYLPDGDLKVSPEEDAKAPLAQQCPDPGRY